MSLNTYCQLSVEAHIASQIGTLTMKRFTRSCLDILRSCALMTWLLTSATALTGQDHHNISPEAELPTYRIVDQIDNLPFKDVTDLEYDSDGLLWIATRNGLYCYNGYQLRPYRRDGRHLDKLSDNEVRRVHEDHRKRLWIATPQGLDRLDKRTEIIEHLHPDGLLSQGISQIEVLRNGDVWLATDDGFVRYDDASDTFEPLPITDETGQPKIVTGECILEDHRGYLWLGTWSDGLYRYEPHSHELVHYPVMNERNSAHVLLEDDQKRIWVAGWGGGIHVLGNAWDLSHLSWQTFREPDLIGGNTYSMMLDTQRHQIMVGSSRGLTLADTEHLGHFAKLIDEQGGGAMPGEEITGIVRSTDGLTWVGMIGHGVTAIEPDQARFRRSTLPTSVHSIKTAAVRSIFAGRQGHLWLGIGTQGLAVQDLATGVTYNWTELPALNHTHATMSTVYAITQTYDGHIWTASYGGELIDITLPPAGQDLRKLTAVTYDTQTSQLAPSDRIFTLYEDRSDNLWIGGRRGLVMRRPDGTVLRLDSLRLDETCTMRDIDVRQVVEDAVGNIWVAAVHKGVFRLTPHGSDWQVAAYSTRNGRLGDDEAQSVCCDSEGHIWVGSNYGDLYLYDPMTDMFGSMKEPWHLAGASVSFVMEDPASAHSSDDKTLRLWVGTNEGLLLIAADKDLSAARVLHYTTEDGLIDDQLLRNAVTCDAAGHIYIGTYKGYNVFDPEELRSDERVSARVMLSELLVGDIPWQELPDEERWAVSSVSPLYARRLTLSHSQTDFALGFTQTGLRRRGDCRFAYQLSGYDTSWRYTTGDLPRAYYSNLPPGNYTFRACIAEDNYTTGNLSDVGNLDMLEVSICILPPWWATWWAKMLYALFGALALFLIYNGVRSLKSYYKRLLVHARERAALRKGSIILKPEKPKVTDADKEFMQRAVSLINQHLSDTEYDQQRFLDDMGVSKATCFRRLKALTGQNYTSFVRDIKMKAAISLQHDNPNIRISDLAYAVGFSDPKYFSVCFKKYREAHA